MIAQVFFINTEKGIARLSSGASLRFLFLENSPGFASLGVSKFISENFIYEFIFFNLIIIAFLVKFNHVNLSEFTLSLLF